MLDDRTLQNLVMEELEWEPRVDPAHIGVAVTNGVVTLSGFVDSYAAKYATECAVARVRGVKAVAEELEVRLPEDQKHADSEIAERAVRILTWDIEVPERQIHIKVEHGIVTLEGKVEHYFQRSAAEADVRQLGGVCGVNNLITVHRRDTDSTQPHAVRERIAEALKRNAVSEAAQIGIEVDSGKVTLTGHVKSWFERGVIREAAWAAPGVSEVRDQLLIHP